MLGLSGFELYSRWVPLFIAVLTPTTVEPGKKKNFVDTNGTEMNGILRAYTANSPYTVFWH